MKITYRTVIGILSAVLILTAVGCGSKTDNPMISNEPLGSEGAVLSLADVPAEHRPEVSDPKAVEAHGVSMTATYTVPNGVAISVAMRNGADRGSLTVSRMPIFERYESGTWVPMAGQEEVNQHETMDTSHFLAPMEMHFAMPHFPEAGVYRCVILCGGEVTAEHYAYFEVPAFTLTAPTADECPSADVGDAPLTVTARDVTAEGLTLVLSPKSGEKATISYGAPYFISCHIDGEWRAVAGDSSFIMILYITEIEGEHEMKCQFGEASPLGAGHYRFAKNFDGVTYYVYFEITE